MLNKRVTALIFTLSVMLGADNGTLKGSNNLITVLISFYSLSHIKILSTVLLDLINIRGHAWESPERGYTPPKWQWKGPRHCRWF